MGAKFNIWNRISARKVHGVWYAYVGRVFPGKTKRQAIGSALRWIRKDNRTINANVKVATWIASRGKEKTSRHPLFVAARDLGFWN